MNLLFTLRCPLFSLCCLPLLFFPFELIAFSRRFLSLITEYIPVSLSWLCRWNLCHHQSSPTSTHQSSPKKKKASKISDFLKIRPGLQYFCAPDLAFPLNLVLTSVCDQHVNTVAFKHLSSQARPAPNPFSSLPWLPLLCLLSKASFM